MAAPTFVAEYESVWNSSASPKSVTVTTAVGDVLVVVGVSENYQASAAMGTPSGGTGLTWTARQQVQVADYCGESLWTAVATTAETFTLSITKVNNGNFWGFNVLRFSGSSGIGASSKANASGAPSLSLTTTAADSAIVVGVGDWNAADGTSRTWRSVNGSAATEQTYFRDASRYTLYVGRHANAGAVGAKTVGLSAPSSQKYGIVAVEVLGTGGGSTSHPAAGTAAVISGTSASMSARLTAAGTAAATALTVGAAAALLAASGAAASTSGSTGAATVLKAPTSGIATLTSAATGAATTLRPSSGAASATSGAAGQATALRPADGTAAAVSGSSGSANVVGGSATHPAGGVAAVVSGSSGATAARLAASGAAVSTTGSAGEVSLCAVTSGVAPSISASSGAVNAIYLVGGSGDVVSGSSGSARGTSDVIPVAPPSRTLTVPAESRRLTVTPESRTLAIPAESRTLEAR